MRKKSKKEITIKSSETKITVGLLFVIAGLAILLSPFLKAELFTYFYKLFGYSAVLWGTAILYLSLRFFTSKKELKSVKLLLGLVLLSIAVCVLFTFLVPVEVLDMQSSYEDSGGLIGFRIHTTMDKVFGRFLEFLIICVTFIVAVSLTTGIKLEQMKSFLGGIVLGFSNFFRRTPKENVLAENETGPLGIKRTEIHYLDEINPAKSTIAEETADIAKNGVQSNEMAKKITTPIYIQNDNSKAQSEANNESYFSKPQYAEWDYPPAIILKEPVVKPQNNEIHKRNAAIIEKTLESFGVQSKVVSTAIGPTVVQYALSITIGTKVAKIKNLANDLALALATSASAVRIEAPIPGTSLIGIEIPNPTPNFVYERELVEQLNQSKTSYTLPLILGKSVSGQCIIKDLCDMPHLLVAGATGTGKSVGINSMLIGMLMTKSPDELRLILVDPKMVEMSPYNGIPHLLTPVITDMELVINALQWAIEEMLRRYRILKQEGVRKIKEYNQKLGYNALPYIVIVIDEMADLMLSTGVDVESKIVRLTQMSRAVGIHLVLATQRPSVDVITGLIKANVPGRIAFSVATAIDSRVIIDQTGAEALIGKGDMLFKSPEYQRPLRIQGAWTDTKDIENVIDYIKSQTKVVQYFDDIVKPKQEENPEGQADGDFSQDTMFEDALSVVVNAQKASASLLQRKLRIGYNRAARLMDELEEAGAIGQADGSNARKVLVTSVDQILGTPVEEIEAEPVVPDEQQKGDIFDDGILE